MISAKNVRLREDTGSRFTRAELLGASDGIWAMEDSARPMLLQEAMGLLSIDTVPRRTCDSCPSAWDQPLSLDVDLSRTPRYLSSMSFNVGRWSGARVALLAKYVRIILPAGERSSLLGFEPEYSDAWPK